MTLDTPNQTSPNCPQCGSIVAVVGDQQIDFFPRCGTLLKAVAVPREEEIFDQAGNLVDDKRAQFLNVACGDDTSLRQRVDALLSVTAVRVMLMTLLMISPCVATERYFPDIRVESNNHRYVVEAKSPYNVDGNWKYAFQSRFVYQLTDQTEGRQIWSRDQPMELGDDERRRALEAPPLGLYVSDDGWVVIRTADYRHPMELLAVSRTGEVTGRVRLSDMLYKSEEGIWSLSTAGMRWGTQYCHFYFSTLHDAPCFCIRGWWGDRLVINLSTGHEIELDSEDEKVLFEAEKQFVLSTLTAMTDWQWTTTEGRTVLVKQADQPGLTVGMLAMHMAGTMKLQDAAPLLLALQSCPYVGRTSGSFGPYKPTSDGIEPYSYQNLTIRQLSQLSLRRIGLRPSGYQATKLYRAGEGYWHPKDPITFDRAVRVGEIVKGETPEKILEKIGAPDFIDSKVWEYDIDESTPYTLRIEWGEAGVEKFTRRTPPSWADGITRDRYLAF